MELWQAVVLGVIQGLTEFLPISSTAHLLAARQAMGHPHPEDAFTTVIQLGSLAAVFVYFRADIARMLRAVWGDWQARRFGSSPDARLAWLIALGTIPVVAVGLAFKKKIKDTFYDLPTMGAVAILFALLLWAAEVWHRIRKQDQHRSDITEERVDWRVALWVGVWQALALMPGASRSGTTLTAALFAGMSRSTGARFSFLLSLPSILGAGLKDLYDEYKLLKDPTREPRPSLFASADELTALAVGTLVSAVVGYLAIAWLIGYLRKRGTGVFIGYRLLLGCVLLGLFLAGRVR
jgi:undecaprenyl-diphosphatase